MTEDLWLDTLLRRGFAEQELGDLSQWLTAGWAVNAINTKKTHATFLTTHDTNTECPYTRFCWYDVNRVEVPRLSARLRYPAKWSCMPLRVQ